MKAVFGAMLVTLSLSTALANAPACRAAFVNGEKIENNYPTRDLSRYLTNGDMLNFMEVGNGEVHRAVGAMKYDFIRQNHIYELLDSKILSSPAKKLVTESEGLRVEATKVEGSDELLITWKQAGQSTKQFRFLKRSFYESFEDLPGNGDKAEKYRRIFDGEYGNVNPEALNQIMKSELQSAELQLNGRPITVQEFDTQISRYRLNALMSLLPKRTLAQQLAKAARKVKNQGERSGSTIRDRWNDLDNSATVEANATIGNNFAFKMESQALKIDVRVNQPNNEVVFEGVVDKYSLEGTKAQRSFTITLKDGEFTITGGAAKSGIETRLVYDVQDMLMVLVPNWHKGF
jgi:hypothetical protein